MSGAYYNEHNPGAAAWLRELIKRGLIAPGEVDERSIEDVRPDDLRGYVQCHFFAGIGGWAYALDLAGWPRDRPVWTGSCPCQPFSQAGEGNGFEDERHLWPAWQHLIAQRDPPVIFGEQVSSKDAEPWYDLVQSDLEGLGYAFGCLAFPSAGIGSPNLRDRGWWVAHSDRLEGWGLSAERTDQCAIGSRGLVGGLADACGERRAGQLVRLREEAPGRHAPDLPETGGRGFALFAGGQLANSSNVGSVHGATHARQVDGFWRDADWIPCRDGKWRPVEPGTFPLAHGIPARVGRLRGYGNAINPYAAEAFIRSFADVMAERALEEIQQSA